MFEKEVTVKKNLGYFSRMKKSFVFHQAMSDSSRSFRNAIKWVFDFARNLIVVGLVLFLAIKSNSTLLYSIAFGGIMMLGLYLSSYLDAFAIHPFRNFKNPIVTLLFNFLSHLVTATLMTWLCARIVLIIINEIAQSYLLKVI